MSGIVKLNNIKDVDILTKELQNDSIVLHDYEEIKNKKVINLLKKKSLIENQKTALKNAAKNKLTQPVQNQQLQPRKITLSLIIQLAILVSIVALILTILLSNR